MVSHGFLDPLVVHQLGSLYHAIHVPGTDLKCKFKYDPTCALWVNDSPAAPTLIENGLVL
ncbi:MAG: hypothetical protein DRP64_08405 [Verrucomicrobia bacterium]|nr:MAG: hypothetical protein DRP64_08405 [Verrucomicrobiota bacterium]